MKGKTVVIILQFRKLLEKQQLLQKSSSNQNQVAPLGGQGSPRVQISEKHGNIETRKHRNTETQNHGSTEIRKCRNTEIWKYRNIEIQNNRRIEQQKYRNIEIQNTDYYRLQNQDYILSRMNWTFPEQIY